MDNFQKRMLEEIFKLVTILTEYTKERENSGQAMGCAEIEKEISDMTNKAKIRTRANGTYELRYRRDGVSKSFYGKTKLEVNEKFKNWRKEQKQDKKQIQIKKKITFGEWFLQYMELYKAGKVAPKTYSNLQSLINVNMHQILDKELYKVSHMDLQRCINDMQAGYSTQKKAREYVKDILACAIRNKLLKENVAEGLTITRPTQARSAYLSKEQIEKLLQLDTSIMRNRYYLFCFYTGARASEGLRFKLSDIDREKQTLLLRGTKTKRALRTIPLFPSIDKLFPEGENLPDEVFADLKESTMLKNFKKIMDGNNVKDLRTTFATVCHEKGIPAKVVQKWMGHSKIDMTMNVYTKVRDDFEYTQAEKML